MRACQALWDPSGELLLWVECVRNAPANAQDFLDGQYQHPFLSELDELEAYLASIDCPPSGSRECTLFLPTDDTGPLVSQRLRPTRALPQSSSAYELRPWTVSTLVLSPIDAAHFFSSFTDQPPASPDFIFDDSVFYWRDATKFTLELLSRGRFLPTIRHDQNKYGARWTTLPDESRDFSRLRQLADSMPAVCRSLSVYETPHNASPLAILESYVEETADALIRMFLKRSPLTTSTPSSTTDQRKAVSIAWAQGLTAENNEVTGPDYELLKLEQRLRAWNGSQLKQRSAVDLQTVFRLRAPQTNAPGQEDTLTWSVEFLLRAIDDDRKTLSARQLWLGQMGFLEQSELSPEEIEESLLRDLGRAATIFPELERALTGRFPIGLSLSTEEAYRLLADVGPRLHEMGIETIFPSWWDESDYALGLRLSVNAGEHGNEQASYSSMLSRDQLLDFRWTAIVGERELSIEEFMKLTEKRTPLLNIGGKWVKLDPARVEATLGFLQEQSKRQKISLMEALHLGLGLGADRLALPVLDFQASGWVEQLLQGGHQALEQICEPENFMGSLRPYQRDGLSWLMFLTQLGIGGCLADDMGLGKTVQFLAYLLLQSARRKKLETGVHQPYLLVVPMSILANWEQEAHRFAPDLRVYVHHGAQRLSGAAFSERISQADLVITTYSLVFRDEEQLTRVSWYGVALDEAQNIKNLDTKQTQAVRRMTRRQMSDPKRTLPLQRVALTGTPLENRLDELWSIFDFLNPGFLGTVEDFRGRFAVPIERHRDQEASKSLSRLLQPFVMRRLKSDPRIIDDLPEKIEMEVLTSLTAEQANLYQHILEDMLPQVDGAQGIHRKGLVLATITRLKQICDHPALFLKDGSEIGARSHKIARLEQILEVVLAEGDKALVFTQFAQLGHLLQPYLAEKLNTEVLFLHGALPKNARDKIVQRFQRPDGPSIFLLSLKAGGFGLNLTEANQVIHVDQWWNPAVQEQATDRAYRIGQKRNVQVRTIICQGTLEQRIAEMLRRKQEIADEVVGSTRDWVTKMSTDELRNLLQLTSASL